VNNKGINYYHYQNQCEDEMPLRVYLQEKHGYSSRILRRIVRDGYLKVNGRDSWLVDNVRFGDAIEVMLPKETVDVQPAQGEMDVIYEDDEILAVNKEAGLVTHPTKSHQLDTLGNLVAGYFELTGQHAKVRFVTRLDCDTSGVIVIAKNKYVHHYLQSHRFIPKPEKRYLAFVNGCPKEMSGTIDLPIDRAEDGIHRCVAAGGKPSVTHYRVIEIFPGQKASAVALRLETGRTHQIRVHLAAIGCPIIGDPLYNTAANETYSIRRTALHAHSIALSLPKTGQHILYAPLKSDMVNLQHQLQSNCE
jgi:23S rRNA pseudouridine1911/1915/1917 synthase